MTDGGKMARRSARVFADEYQPSQEKAPREGGHIPAIRERDEKQMEISRSRGSSCSSLSLVNFEMDMYAEVASNDSSRDVTPGPESIKYSKEKVKGRPVNFGTVMPGFYRSGYPQTEDHEYLKSLGLKTIITLVQKDFPEGYQLFMETNGIKHIVVDIQGTKKVNIPLAVMKSVMEVALDRRNYPMLMHCNHGKHRTGCVVAIIRKVMGWRLDTIIEEYTAYAIPKSRESDIKYIRGFEVQSLPQLLQDPGRDISSKITFPSALSRARWMRMVAVSILMLSLYLWAFAIVQLHQ